MKSLKICRAICKPQMFNYFCFVLFFFCVTLSLCVTIAQNLLTNDSLSSYMAQQYSHESPPRTTFFGSCSRFSIVPLYTLLMTTALSPPLPSPPLPTLCDNDLYLRKSNDPINKNIYFLDRIIIITVEYSRVLD